MRGCRLSGLGHPGRDMSVRIRPAIHKIDNGSFSLKVKPQNVALEMTVQFRQVIPSGA